jgi:hypothetical protein
VLGIQVCILNDAIHLQVHHTRRTHRMTTA